MKPWGGGAKRADGAGKGASNTGHSLLSTVSHGYSETNAELAI